MNYYLMNASLSFKSYRVRKIGILILLVPRQNTSKDLSQQGEKKKKEYGDTWQFVTRNHVLTNLCQWSR
jgi:hypothetical protein